MVAAAVVVVAVAAAVAAVVVVAALLVCGETNKSTMVYTNTVHYKGVCAKYRHQDSRYRSVNRSLEISSRDFPKF